MDEYVSIQVCSRARESASEFSKRLTEFWTVFLRSRPDDYRGVYAESTRFQPAGDAIGRNYLVNLEVVSKVETELASAGIRHEPIDRDDIFSKFEAVAPEWFQIPH